MAALGTLPEATLTSGELSMALRDGPHAALVSATHPAAKATSRIDDSHATAMRGGVFPPEMVAIGDALGTPLMAIRSAFSAPDVHTRHMGQAGSWRRPCLALEHVN